MEWAIGAFLVSFVIGATGVGGGSLMTPLLMLLGASSGVAGGTALLQAGVSKAFGGYLYGKERLVSWSVVRSLWYGSLPTAAFWVWLKWWDASVNTWLALNFNFLVVGMLLLSVLALWIKLGWIPLRQAKDRSDASLVVAGVLLGTMVSLTSIGAGILGTLALLTLRPSLGVREMVGTEIVHAVPLAFIASVGFVLTASMDFTVLGMLLLGALPGMWLGSRWTVSFSDRVSTMGVSGILLSLSIYHAVGH